MKIIYNNNGLKILTPGDWLKNPDNVPDNQWDLILGVITAEKDVPAGLPFKIILDSDLPDRSTRLAWEVDDSLLTDGVGLTKEQFEKKYPNLKGVAIQ